MDIIVSGDDEPTPVTQESFRELCSASIRCHEDGTGCILSVRCGLKDQSTGEVHVLERTVDLAPYLQMIKKGIAAYHSKLHNEQSDAHVGQMMAHEMFEDDALYVVSGLFDSISSSIVSMAQNKATADLFKTAAPLLASAVPGGSILLPIALSAAQTTADAKAGDPAAQAHVQSVTRAAYAGDPSAQQMAKMMRAFANMLDTKTDKQPSSASIGATLALGAGRVGRQRGKTSPRPPKRSGGIRRGGGTITARHPGMISNYAQRYEGFSQDPYGGGQGQIQGQGQGYGGGGGGDSGGGGGGDDGGGYDGGDPGQGYAPPAYGPAPAPYGMPPYPQMFYGPGPFGQPPLDPMGVLAQQMGPLPPDMPDPFDVFDAQQALDNQYSDMAQSGWLYNQPYRTPADAVIDAASGKSSPGVGLTIRGLTTGGFQTMTEIARAKIAAGK